MPQNPKTIESTGWWGFAVAMRHPDEPDHPEVFGAPTSDRHGPLRRDFCREIPRFLCRRVKPEQIVRATEVRHGAEKIFMFVFAKQRAHF